jgi:hypothetical protein
MRLMTGRSDPGTDGVHQAGQSDPGAADEEASPDEEAMEEISSQLWVVPRFDRVVEPNFHGGRLAWVRKELVREG